MKREHTTWHHAPLHVFVPNTIYMVTSGTLYKEHVFVSHERLSLLEALLFRAAKQYGWELRAWAVFSNHYHFIARSPENADNLSLMIKHLHSDASRQVNRMDSRTGRKVWHQYWDKCLTFERSYYARLNYVNNNPVHHGLVALATQYPFCSARWFESEFRKSFQKKVGSFRYDRLNEPDNYSPAKCNDRFSLQSPWPHLDFLSERNSQGKAAVELPHSEVHTSVALEHPDETELKTS